MKSDINQPQTPDNEVARLREELDRFKLGFQGSCYACEPVGEMNHKLEAEVAKLRELLEWAETLLCNAEHPQHCGDPKWSRIVHKWRDQKHALAPAPEEPTIQKSLQVQQEPLFPPIHPEQVLTPEERTEQLKHNSEVARLKEMVIDASRRGDELAAHWKERAEKAESIIKQLHHFAGIIEGFQNETK